MSEMKAKLVKALDRPVKPLPTSEYVEVTPEMAKEWLANAASNRTIHDLWVDRYADRMRRGDWMVTDQGIAFNEDGQLINGQHRLHAVIKANRPVVMLVTRGLDSRSQLVMDQGVKRQVHEQIALREGWEVTPMHIAVAKAMVDNIGGPGHEARRLIKTDAQLMERFYLRHHDAVEWTVHQFNQEAYVRGVSIAPVMGPVARAWYHEDHAELMNFSKVVVTGEAQHRNDQPAVALRNWLIAHRDRHISGNTAKRPEIYMKSAIALQFFLKGLQLEQIGKRRLDRDPWPIPGEDAPREAVKAT